MNPCKTQRYVNDEKCGFSGHFVRLKMLRLRLFVVTDTDLYLQQPQLKTQQIAFLCFQNAFLCVAPHPGDSCQVVSGAHFILGTQDPGHWRAPTQAQDG